MDIYTIILIISVIAGFLMAFSLGANDVSNAMASSVAAKAITLKQAMFLAAVLNFIGAVFLGSSVVGTIAKGIISPDAFTDASVFMIGMLAALLSAGLWVLIASITSFPVSSTHSIIGSIIGFGIVSGHFYSINWSMLAIVFSAWILSPFIGALFSFIVFTMIRNFILYRKRIMYHALFWAPFWIGVTATIIILSFVFKTPYGKSLGLGWGWGAVIAVGIMSLCIAVGLIIRYRIRFKKEDRAAQKVEGIFGKMQVSTACFLALSQGSNDVANAIGPVAAILFMLADINAEHPALTGGGATIPLWLLIMGGVGIATGIACLGKNVMATLGERITRLNHTRGFSVELSAASTVLFASNLGLPVSTTHASVGAIVGVGLAKGFGAVDFRVLYQIFIYWLITIPVAAVTCSLIFLILKALFL